MDSDRAGLGGAGVTSRQWVVVDGFHKVSFSSRMRHWLPRTRLTSIGGILANPLATALAITVTSQMKTQN